MQYCNLSGDSNVCDVTAEHGSCKICLYGYKGIVAYHTLTVEELDFSPRTLFDCEGERL